MGNCCGGAGCCVIPTGSCPARGGQVVSIIGLILAVIFLILSTFIYPMIYVATIVMHFLPGLGIAIYIVYLNLISAIVAFSLPICCCTSKQGYKCSSIMNGIMAGLYVVGIMCAAISHGRLDAFLDEHCDPGDSGCDDFEQAMHAVFSILYACIILNMIFSGLACGLFWKAMPHWDAMETPAAGTSAAVPAAAVEITESVGAKA